MQTEYFIPPIPIGRRRSTEAIFRKFFDMGLEESASPFLNLRSRNLARNLPLKSALVAAFLLALAFACLYVPTLAPLATILLASVYLIVGVPALINAWEDVVLKKDVNIDVLMTIAAFSSFIVGSGYEGALLLVLFALSGAIEDAVTLKAKNALSSLHALVPTKVALIRAEDDEVIERAIQDVQCNSHILVRAGEIVPLDGQIFEGASLVNMEHLTGESIPVRKQVGDIVPSGALLIDGALKIRVTHTSGDSTISRIIQLVTSAKEAKPKLESWFDYFSKGYALAIIAFSFLSAIAMAHLLDIPYLGRSGSIYRALAFLIAASPCALILAVPIAYLSAVGSCAKKGI
jgi:Cd2+/Zn2+-exporting ATPase